jgi:diguanylate cyclase (GGDEF)-like protein/PAS domain S-box-containing protein
MTPAPIPDSIPPGSTPFERLAQVARQGAGARAIVLVDGATAPPMVLATAGASVAEAEALTGTDTGDLPVGWWISPGADGVHLMALDVAPASHAWLTSVAALAGEVRGLAHRMDQTAQRNERLLRDSQSRQNLTEQTAGLGSWTWTVADDRLEHSREFATILGLGPNDRIDTLAALVHRYTPEWRDGMRQWVTRCARAGEGFDEEMQVGSDSGAKWVRTVGSPVRDAQGRVVQVQGVLQDISTQKQAQQETLRLAMRLTTTLASITEAFVTLDRQCCYTYLNQESERLLQKSTGELLGLPVWDGLAEPLARRMQQHMERSLTSNRRVEFEEYFGALGKWIEVRAYPFAEGLAVYFRDVTQRRRAQEQLMLLETSVARLNDIVLIAETGVAGGEGARIVFVNDAFEHHTGLLRADVLGQPPSILKSLDPSGGATLQSLNNKLRHQFKARTEMRVQRPAGPIIWVELEVVMVQAQADQMTHWVAVGRDITQRKNAEDMIRHLAFYDALTDLPNRQLLMDRLQRAVSASARTGQFGALMFIDLDNFKILNDTLGHHMGDQLLQKVGARLVNSVRKTDVVARLGGDEFVVMADDLSTDPQAAAQKSRVLADKVLRTLREPFLLNGHQHFATPSIGVATFQGEASDVGELLKQADLAMYQAKSLGRNTVCFFDPGLQAAVSANATISRELREAINAEQFVLHYQPQVDRAGVIAGVEALIRWRHPQRGLVQPADFIPVAEDTGLILPMGQWAIEEACRQLAAWAKRPDTAHLSVAVNVSVRQFRHPDFVDMVMAAIARTGIGPQRLKLELTESLLADRMEITIQKMGKLKALGVTLALDDFGVGYSSLSVLKRLPLDQLKIDKGFVADVLTDPNDAAISRAIIALAQSLSLQVVAEGVETMEQRDFLAYQGCDQFQGYLFSRPLPLAELEALLQRTARSPMMWV